MAKLLGSPNSLPQVVDVSFWNNSRCWFKPSGKLTWLAGKWTMNESMYFLWKMGDISAIAMLVYWRVVHQDVDPQSVNLGVQVGRRKISHQACGQPGRWSMIYPQESSFSFGIFEDAGEILEWCVFFFFQISPDHMFFFVWDDSSTKSNTSSNSSQKNVKNVKQLVSAAILSLVPGGNRTCHCERCGFQVCTGSRGDRTTCREMGWIGMVDGMGNLLGDLILKFKVGY